MILIDAKASPSGNGPRGNLRSGDDPSPRAAVGTADPTDSPMDQAQLNWITNFIWNIADDVLRDVFVRGKYRDVILPMTVLRRLDAVL